MRGHGGGAVPVERGDGGAAAVRGAGGPAAAADPGAGAAVPRRPGRRNHDLLAANVSANLLGLGNAATPLGLRAAERMARASDGRASDDLCRFVVCNTASIQLVPTTVAAVRSAAGCETPFDILPAVWLTSALALTAGLLACGLLARLWRD